MWRWTKLNPSIHVEFKWIQRIWPTGFGISTLKQILELMICMHFFKFAKMQCMIFYNQWNYLFISGYKSMMHSIKKVSPGQTFAGKLFLLLIRSRLIESSSDYTMYWYDASSIKGSHFFRFSKMQCWCYVIFYNQWNFTWSFHLKSTFSEKLGKCGHFCVKMN